MNSAPRPTLLAGAAVALLLATGCTPRADTTPPDMAAAVVVAQVSCERALAELDDAIATCEQRGDVSADRLAEARSLREEAFDLYVSAEYELSLQLAQEALALLRNTPQ